MNYQKISLHYELSENQLKTNIHLYTNTNISKQVQLFSSTTFKERLRIIKYMYILY